MDIVNRNRVKSFITKDTSEIREILAPGNSCLTRQSLAEATLGPGKSTEAHRHPTAEEIYYILAGEGSMSVEAEASPVRSGDAIAILPGRAHQIRNTGTAPLVFLCCCSPAYSHEDTVLVERNVSS